MLTPKASSRPTKTSPRLIAQPRREAAADRQRDADADEDQRPTHRQADRAVDQEADRGKGEPGSERPGDDPDRPGFDARHRYELAGTGTAGAQQGKFTTVAVDRTERRQVGQAERQQRARDSEHDEKRLRVEGVAGGRFEPFGEVVDELDLAGQAAFDRVADLARLLEGLARRPGEAGAVELGLHLPLHSGYGPRHRRRTGARWVDARQLAADLPSEGGDGEDRDVGRGLRRRRPDQGVQRLKEDVGRGDEGDASDTERPRLATTEAKPDRVSDPGPQRRRQLLV